MILITSVITQLIDWLHAVTKDYPPNNHGVSSRHSDRTIDDYSGIISACPSSRITLVLSPEISIWMVGARVPPKRSR